MNAHQAIVSYIKAHVHNVKTLYDWEPNLKNFPVSSYQLEGKNYYEKNRKLRNFIHNIILTDSKFSTELLVWYVTDWGGVRGNKNETLLNYIASSPSDLMQLGKKGVASWSKILAVKDPNKFAIYDARVALSINSIQKLLNVDTPIFFPQLLSQNSSYVAPTQKIIENSKFFKNRKPDSAFYHRYLKILADSTDELDGYDIQDAEMLLFSSAEPLSKIWLEKR